MSKLKIAIQKSGRLSEGSLNLLKESGIKLAQSDRKLLAEAKNFPLELLFLRDDDIPQYVEMGAVDIGILGENEVWEKDKDVRVVEKLGFASCRLSLAIPKDEPYSGIDFFANKKIATSYPKTLRRFFEKQQIPVTIEEIGGSVEISPGMGLSDAIFDIVGTGSTLIMNGLKEVERVASSEAVLIAHRNLSPAKNAILDQLLFRISAVRNASENMYILLNAPNHAIEKICNILPGIKSPTVLPLAIEGWSSLHSVIREDQFWEILQALKNHGAEGILAMPIGKLVV